MLACTDTAGVAVNWSRHALLRHVPTLFWLCAFHVINDVNFGRLRRVVDKDRFQGPNFSGSARSRIIDRGLEIHTWDVDPRHVCLGGRKPAGIHACKASGMVPLSPMP